MKVLVLLLFSLQDCAKGMINYTCGQDQRFRIIKNNTAYQLQLCISTDSCTRPTDFITLNGEQNLTSVCDYCKGILGTPEHDCNESECETHIHLFFSNYCKTFNQCVATSLPCTPPSTTPTVCTSEQLLVPAIGAPTCLFLVTLVMVVTGWVWTYWTMKKKIKETQLCKKCQGKESEEQQFCLNQIHTMPTTQPVVGTAIEQLLHSLEESGQSNNGLSSKDNKGYRDVNRVENFYTSSEGSSNSSLQQQEAANRVEEGESGEKHVYHVLEKPGGDDYEDLDKDLEENSAMEYETPLPLKELGLKHASIHT